jgi:tRNA-specific 2-thiouridylase
MASALVAISGGVDSSVALHRSLQLFDSVRACHIDTGKGCPPEAAAVASFLRVDLHQIDGEDAFLKEVVEPSREMLLLGRTPNPCALCNSRVKLAQAHEILAADEVLVTGHYAVHKGDGHLERGVDPSKDQSYFLSMVPLDIIRRCHFPLGNSLKEDVKREAARSGLPCKSSESMDLCFDLNPGSLLGSPGDIIDISGAVVGRHSGLGGYTVGQRKRIGAHGRKLFVIALLAETGRVVIGPEEHLYSRGCTLEGMNWFERPGIDSFEGLISVRYRRRACPARFDLSDNGVEVRFHSPEKAVAPGQVGALYVGSRLIGGGLITGVEKMGGSEFVR